MPVPSRPIPLLRRVAGLLVLALASGSGYAISRQAEPVVIPLDTLGYQPISNELLLAGGSMLTLHYVDDRHLLVTFTVHRLMRRLADEPEDDQDRNVDAVLLELPSGHILARTSWRLHDRGQYLWGLGHGRFLLRIRDSLITIAPLANLSTPEPFHEAPFLTTEGRRIAALMLSPGEDLLTVETMQRNSGKARSASLGGGSSASLPDISGESNPVQINFYRIYAPAAAGPEVHPQAAGVVRAPSTGNIASDSAGYVAIVDQGRQEWAFDFNTWTGKNLQLSVFDSTCRPSPWLVNRGEFVAFGCHLGGREVLGGFNMKGDEMWEQGMYGQSVSPSFTFSPESGRFALSRILISSATVSDQALTNDEINGQSITVYQAGTGRQLLRAQCSPVARAGQNFALSPNGLGLAVVHEDAIEVWPLSPLTTKEQTEVKLAQASAPEDTGAPVRFPSATQVSARTVAAASAPADSSVVIVSTDAAESTVSTRDVTASPAPATVEDGAAKTVSLPEGDPPPDAPRKRPTLYTLPDDQAHGSAPDDQPR